MKIWSADLYFIQQRRREPMLNWLKRICVLYMKGARENDFPISEYGLLANRKSKHKCDNDLTNE